jgi:PIN domain nuclease of toxin-antitoxin system
MRYLLDTHILLWWVEDDPRLKEPARTTISNPDHDVLVNAASARWASSASRRRASWRP